MQNIPGAHLYVHVKIPSRAHAAAINPIRRTVAALDRNIVAHLVLDAVQLPIQDVRHMLAPLRIVFRLHLFFRTVQVVGQFQSHKWKWTF